MAEEQHAPGAQLDQSQFCCAVCLDLLKEPVTTHCGHNYCRHCIEECWDHMEETGTYSCPQCRETFDSRPVLRRNNMLAEVVEKLKVSSTHQAAPYTALPCAGPSDIACDFCCGTKPKKATMSCLTCLASYCPSHLEPHTAPVLRTHQLIAATVPVQSKICSKSGKLMDLYCRTDKKLVCYLCTITDHKHHSMTTATAERAVQQTQVVVRQKKVQKKSQEREKELKELGRALKDFKLCTQTTVKSCDNIFDDLISSIKKRHALMKLLIEEQEKDAVVQAEKLQLQLEEEIAKLQRRDADLQKLALIEDHIHFIQTFQTLSSSSSSSADSSRLPSGAVVRPRSSIKALTGCVFELKNAVEKLLDDTWPRISATVTTAKVIQPLVPKKRDEFFH